MALDSYSDLQTSAINWANRQGDPEFATSIVDIIKLAESYLNRKLRIRDKILYTTLTGTADSRQAALPSDFREPFSVYLTTYGEDCYLPPIIGANHALSSVSGVPSHWYIKGDYLEFDCPLDQAHTFKFWYRATALDLATTAPNWLLTNHPDVYLNAVMYWGYKYISKFDKASVWKSELTESLDDVNWEEARSDAVAPLRVDPALVRGGSFDINSGDY